VITNFLQVVRELALDAWDWVTNWRGS
jgi:hypothetical protein